MSAAPSDRPTKPASRPRSAAPVLAPAMPPPTEEERLHAERISVTLRELIDIATRRNLNNAVQLAQQAARGQGPLVEHFGELGRRFGHLLDAPAKPALKVVKGGAA